MRHSWILHNPVTRFLGALFAIGFVLVLIAGPKPAGTVVKTGAVVGGTVGGMVAGSITPMVQAFSAGQQYEAGSTNGGTMGPFFGGGGLAPAPKAKGKQPAAPNMGGASTTASSPLQQLGASFR